MVNSKEERKEVRILDSAERIGAGV